MRDMEDRSAKESREETELAREEGEEVGEVRAALARKPTNRRVLIRLRGERLTRRHVTCMFNANQQGGLTGTVAAYASATSLSITSEGTPRTTQSSGFRASLSRPRSAFSCRAAHGELPVNVALSTRGYFKTYCRHLDSCILCLQRYAKFAGPQSRRREVRSFDPTQEAFPIWVC